MSIRPDVDQTLPSVTIASPGVGIDQSLVLTIIFHPDTARIGEVARLSCLDGAAPGVLGRRSPAFARAAGGPAAPLDDAHVSRQALAMVSEKGQVEIRRLPSSSRCRIDGRELRDSVALSQAQLKKGVPMLLGHSVVLLLRLVQWTEPAAPPAATAELRGSSGYMVRLRDQVARLAPTGLDVLVRGETGTGKELVASALHAASERCRGPMVSVNMAAIPPGLAAATLFGSVRGAFTGATGAKEGLFSQAEQGTLFLDEIGDAPSEVQPQLLRALQQREVQVVGGAVRKVDVRVISATDAPLETRESDFKAALRYRLGAGEISLLSLRDHPEDIGELLLHFLSLNFEQLERSGLLPAATTPAPEIAAWADLFHQFLGFDWPGNVRQLANFAGQVALASERQLSWPDNIRLAMVKTPARATGANAKESGARRRRMHDVSEAEFNDAMKAGAYEVTDVARQLGVSRQSVYRRMDESSDYRLAGQVPHAELERALAERGGDAALVAKDLQLSLSGLRSRLRDSGLEWF